MSWRGRRGERGKQRMGGITRYEASGVFLKKRLAVLYWAYSPYPLLTAIIPSSGGNMMAVSRSNLGLTGNSGEKLYFLLVGPYCLIKLEHLSPCFFFSTQAAEHSENGQFKNQPQKVCGSVRYCKITAIMAHFTPTFCCKKEIATQNPS